MTELSDAVVLIVEDGDEYLDSLSRYVPGPRYLQAKSGGEALELLSGEAVQLLYLDMRFDRIDPAELLGDLEETLRSVAGNLRRAQERLARDQGLHILAALRDGGHGEVPVILAHDFGREPRRFEHLSRLHPSLTWIPDEVTPEEIRARMDRLLRG
jgi:ActR/RegA family two-component response regulator